MAVIQDKNTEQLNRERERLVPAVTPWLRAYMECNDAVQAVVRDMLDICESEDADEDEKEMAIATVREALFPTTHSGSLGADLEELEEQQKATCPDSAKVIDELDNQEAVFADRVASIMNVKGMTQEQLADAIGVGQPAISMMLARKGRPQRRTVLRIAEALGVSVNDLWP